LSFPWKLNIFHQVENKRLSSFQGHILHLRYPNWLFQSGIDIYSSRRIHWKC
jgi:hypothetical protein